MSEDDSQAEKENLTTEYLLSLPLILLRRMNVRSELANWFRDNYEKINVVFISNLSMNSAVREKISGGTYFLQ